MLQYRVDRVADIMRANGVLFKHGFTDVVAIGFTEEAKAGFFEEIVGEMEDIVLAGVNCGFSWNMKSCLNTLSELSTHTCSDGRRETPLEVLYATRNHCMAHLRMPGNADTLLLRDNVKRYVESAKKGMEILDRCSFSKHRDEIKNEKDCAALLDDIAKKADFAVDFSSAEAVEKYNSIINALREWRNGIARSGGFYDSKTVGDLKKILPEAEKWCELIRTPRKRVGAHEAMDVPEDDLTSVIESEATRLSVVMFLERCEDYVYEVYEMSKTNVAERVRSLRGDLAEIRREQQKVEYDRNHGYLSQADAEAKFEHLSQLEANVNFEISRVQLDEVSERELNFRRNLIYGVEYAIRGTYTYVKSNRLHLHKLFGDINFSKIIGLLNNNLDTREIERTIAEIQNTLMTRGLVDGRGHFVSENIEKLVCAENETV